MNNWTRKGLKTRAKTSFKANYWKSVLAGFIMIIITGGVSAGISGASGAITAGTTGSQLRYNSSFNSYDYDYSYENEAFEEDIDSFFDEFTEEFGEEFEEEFGEDLDYFDDDDFDEYDIYDRDDYYSNATRTALAVAIIVFLIVFTVIFAFASLINIFLCNPLSVGLVRFFYKNDKENAGLDNLGFSFSKNYLNIIKILFFRDIKLIGWSLLLIIPGIIKAYEYRMIPYILQDNPDMNSKEAFTLSKIMMSGNKWKAFVLDLSFIGWEILSALTLGILGIFYVNPYVFQTNANLYAALKGDYEGMNADMPFEERKTANEDVYVEFAD